VSAIIYYLLHFWCTASLFGETACISYSMWYFFNGAATSGIDLRCPALTNVDWLHWLTCYIFTRESSYCFHHVLAIAILSVRLSVCRSICPSVTWVYQSKVVQARITKFSPSAAQNCRYAIQIENLVFVYLFSVNTQFLANILNRNCCRLLRVSWALAQISCTLLQFYVNGCVLQYNVHSLSEL